MNTHQNNDDMRITTSTDVLLDLQDRLTQAEQESTALNLTMDRQTARIAELEAQLEAVGAGGVEPTRAMEDAAIAALGWSDDDVAHAEHCDDDRIDLRVTWRAMLAAAPRSHQIAELEAQPAPAVVEPGPLAYLICGALVQSTEGLEQDEWEIDAERGPCERLSAANPGLKIPLYFAPQPQQIAEPASQAAKDVLAERQRQISAEGWTPEHDDEHDAGQMAGAASCYARHVNARSWVVTELDDGPEVYRDEDAPDHWPWDENWWKPTTPRRDAVKACALLLAEIERIDRATTPKEPS